MWTTGPGTPPGPSPFRPTTPSADTRVAADPHPHVTATGHRHVDRRAQHPLGPRLDHVVAGRQPDAEPAVVPSVRGDDLLARASGDDDARWERSRSARRVVRLDRTRRPHRHAALDAAA